MLTKVPVEEVGDMMNSKSQISKSAIAEMEKFMDSLGNIVPKPENMLYYGSPWGALYEKMTNKKIAPQLSFNYTKEGAIQPWIELLEDGFFSNETLQSVPKNFEISPFWVDKLEESVKNGHHTWLHYLFLGSAHLERGDQNLSSYYLKQSMQLRPSVHAARALAVSAPSVQEARDYFLNAWEIFKLEKETKDTEHLGNNLAMEMSIWLTYQGFWDDLRLWFDDPRVTSAMKLKDRVLHARAALAVNDGDAFTHDCKGTVFLRMGVTEPNLLRSGNNRLCLKPSKRRGVH
eukprot:m.218236 g.218236  ORF g.218236 m.218236 type:complete len:289 (+) comp15902_c0_seq9:1538-2404(+)